MPDISASLPGQRRPQVGDVVAVEARERLHGLVRGLPLASLQQREVGRVDADGVANLPLGEAARDARHLHSRWLAGLDALGLHGRGSSPRLFGYSNTFLDRQRN